jgi:hypothetical protein
MISLPLISHHLYVAAIRHEDSPETQQQLPAQPTNVAAAIPLELLEGAQALTELVARPLRASPVPGMF